MKTKHLNLVFFVLCILLILVSSALAEDNAPARPGPKDKCPVCGMFVAKYPDFIAVVSLKDGTHAFFDGVKDMMKYYFNLQKYAPGRTAGDIVAIHVTDYYALSPIDGHAAFYVVGSDIYGPMGRELIPFDKKEDAEEFKKDHNGTAILGFTEITEEIVKSLDGRQ
jgi:copper chaperone NosL